MASSVSEDNFASLPYEVKETILKNLAVTDLCHVALCSRSWREAANQDALWRPLCQDKGWERYGSVTDLCKEVPFKPTSQDQKTGEGGAPTFPVDAIVTGADLPQLADTCKWKEVYMKAKHLEENWSKNRFFHVSYPYGSKGNRAKPSASACESDHVDKHSASSSKEDKQVPDSNGPEEDLFSHISLKKLHVSSLAGEGTHLAVGIDLVGTLQLWDIFQEKRKHHIKVDISDERHALRMKDGIVAAGCKDGKIRTYSVSTGEQLQVMSGHNKAVSRLFFDGELIISVAHGKRSLPNSDIIVWNAADGTRRCTLGVDSALRLKDVDCRNKKVAGWYSDGLIRVWDAGSGSKLHEINSGFRKLVSFHLGDGILICVSKDFVVKVWNLESGQCVKTFDVPIDPSGQVADDIVTHCVFGGDLFVVFTNEMTYLTVVDFEGRRIGSFLPYRYDFDYVLPVGFDGTRLIADCHEYENRHHNELFVVKNTNKIFSEENSTDQLAKGYVSSVYWMNDTKLAYEWPRKVFDPDKVIPKIVMRHYW